MTVVLVVDDQPGMRETIVELLTLSGYDAISASGTDEALKIANSREVDVVVTDVKMPGRDGVELLLELQGRTVKVILITAYTAEDRLAIAVKAGPFAIAHKPVAPARLLQLVADAAAG